MASSTSWVALDRVKLRARLDAVGETPPPEQLQRARGIPKEPYFGVS
ncbi:MAG TPA: hypothetical protein VGR92_03005 [Steroidobacteraceae bacterium]|nr:hypothetical protein [Steroidobacteraceae bacterium]